MLALEVSKVSNSSNRPAQTYLEEVDSGQAKRAGQPLKSAQQPALQGCDASAYKQLHIYAGANMRMHLYRLLRIKIVNNVRHEEQLHSEHYKPCKHELDNHLRAREF